MFEEEEENLEGSTVSGQHNFQLTYSYSAYFGD